MPNAAWLSCFLLIAACANGTPPTSADARRGIDAPAPIDASPSEAPADQAAAGPARLGAVPGCQADYLDTDTSNVYFTVEACSTASANGVYVVPIAGGTARLLPYSPDSGGNPAGLVDYSGQIFFTDSAAGTLWSAFASGLTAPTKLQSGLLGPTGIVADGAFLVWTDYDGGCVREVPLGSSSSAPTNVACGLGQPYRIANVPGYPYLYWTDRSDGAVYFANETTPFSPYAVAPAGTMNAPSGLALDSNNLIFIADTGNNQIQSADLRGCPARFAPIATGLVSPNGIAVDPALGAVFFADTGDGKIERVPEGGGTVQVLASGQLEPFDLNVRGGEIFWTNQGDGSVWKMPER